MPETLHPTRASEVGSVLRSGEFAGHSSIAHAVDNKVKCKHSLDGHT